MNDNVNPDESVTIRVAPVEQVGIVLKIVGREIQFPCDPKTRWAITVDDGENVEVAAVFDDEAAAVEAAEDLTARLKGLDDQAKRNIQ